jgi:hypothetical protein
VLTIPTKKAAYFPPKLKQHKKFVLCVGASPIRVPIQSLGELLLGEEGENQ